MATAKKRAAGVSPWAKNGGTREGAGAPSTEMAIREIKREMERIRVIQVKAGRKPQSREVILIELAYETLARGMLGLAKSTAVNAARAVLAHYHGLPRQQVELSGGLRFDPADRLDDVRKQQLARIANIVAESPALPARRLPRPTTRTDDHRLRHPDR